MKVTFVFTAALAAIAYASASPMPDAASPLVARDQLADHISCPILDCAKGLASTVSACGKAAISLGRNVIADAQCLAQAVKTVTNVPDACKQCFDEFGL